MPESFDYLICLDFEATCWEERDSDKAEIIEIGAVLVNLKSGSIESEFHEYVRPTRNPILSKYCIDLTGITQEMIDRESSFTAAYPTFINWLSKNTIEKQLQYATPSMRAQQSNRSTTFCSWTNWDLGHFFRLDCERNGLSWPRELRAWSDGRKIFTKTYPGRITFAEALSKIGVHQVHAHSAIDDAKCLAKMMIHLYDRGAKIIVTDWRF